MSNWTECFPTAEDKVLQEQLKNDKTVVNRHYFGLIIIPFAVIGLLLTIAYIVTVGKAIRTHRVSRKCYVLLLNRAFGDLLSCVSAGIISLYIMNTIVPDHNIINLFESLFIGSFWTAMVSYVSLSIIKAYAVARPFHYRQWFRMKRCIRIIIFSWLVFVLLVITTGIVYAFVQVPSLNEWSKCRFETCIRRMYQVRNGLTAACYLVTLVAFVITVIYVVRAERFFNTFDRKKSVGDAGSPPQIHFSLWRLSQNVLTFAVFYLFYTLFALVLLFNPYKCLWQRNASLFLRLLGIIRIMLLLRIICDPILSFFTDKPLRRTFLSFFGIKQDLDAFDSTSSHGKKNSNPPTRITSLSIGRNDGVEEEDYKPITAQPRTLSAKAQQEQQANQLGVPDRPKERVPSVKFSDDNGILTVRF